MTPLVFQLDSPAQTLALGRALGERLFPSSVLALIGELGAGKTLLTRGIAEGLNIANVAAVNSPTFVLIQEYSGRLPIYHFDVYRLQSVDEFLDLGSDEYLTGDGVSIIEWANRVTSALPSDRLDVVFEIVSADVRRVTLTATGPTHSQLVDGLSLPKG